MDGWCLRFLRIAPHPVDDDELNQEFKMLHQCTIEPGFINWLHDMLLHVRDQVYI